jgi:hypothetical protein
LAGPVRRNIQLHYLEHIPSVPKREMILNRLGYSKINTMLDRKNEELLEYGIREGSLLCRPKGVFCRLKIIGRNTELLKLENNIEFVSRNLSAMLEECSEIILMGATVGREVTERISYEVSEGNASLGLIIDSVASQKADACLDWITAFVNRVLRKEGKVITTRRYSPGYGDFDLTNQRIFYDVLQLAKLDLELTEKYILIPEKSVTAVAGIKEK